MNRLIILLLLSLLLAGCVSSAIIPPKEVTGNLREAWIVAMEPHPLGVPPKVTPMLLESGGSIETARGFALLNSIAILAELPAASRRGGQISQSYQSMLDRHGVWVPTQILAREVQAQLGAHGYRTAVAPRLKSIPGMKNRGYTATMENWLGPIRAWYNDTSPVADYGDIRNDQPMFVLEVGVMNYEIESNGELLVQVAMKMIDPVTGSVIGRTRAANNRDMPKLGPVEQAFAGDAGRFKEAFQNTGRKLTEKCLAELGLTPAGGG